MGSETRPAGQLTPPKFSRSFAASNQERDFYDPLISRLADARRERGMSQAALDHRLGVSEGLTAKWESKARLPGAFFLMCWCQALGLELTLKED